MGGEIPRAPVAVVKQPFWVQGWALDPTAVAGTDVDAVEVLAIPCDGLGIIAGDAVLLGSASYGIERPDVGEVYGLQFSNSGFSLNANGLKSGFYQLVIRAHRSSSSRWSERSRLIFVEGTADLHIVLDAPSEPVIEAPFSVGGWAFDGDALAGTGVDAVHVYARQASGPIFLGVAGHGMSRPDVAAVYGSARINSGFMLHTPGLPAGSYVLLVYVHSVHGSWNVLTKAIEVR